jgi:hypothetical protein
MSEPTVVVVGAGGDDSAGAEGAPPAGPAYVTAGELDARLELLESNLRDSIGSAVETAYRAQAEAEEAQEVALTAAAVAADAAAQADQVEEEGDDGEGGDGADDAEVVEDTTPQPPERRSPAPAASRVDRPARRSSYGASWLSGR